jgi:hypothetical protein
MSHSGKSQRHVIRMRRRHKSILTSALFMWLARAGAKDFQPGESE